MSDKHEQISGIIPGVTPDIGDKVSDDEGHTGYGSSRSEADEALEVAQEEDVDTAEKDTRPIVGTLLPGYVLGDKVDDESQGGDDSE